MMVGGCCGRIEGGGLDLLLAPPLGPPVGEPDLHAGAIRLREPFFLILRYISASGSQVHRCTKRWTCFAKQQPDRAKEKFLAI